MADEKAPEAAPAAEAAPAGPKLIMGMPLPMFLFLALNALIMVGGVGYIVQVTLLYKPKPIMEDQVEQEIKKKTARAATVAVNAEGKEEGGPFIEEIAQTTINLRTNLGGALHYATVESAVECSNSACLEQLKTIKARVEDLIQSKIAAKSFSEMSSLDTRFRLRHEILEQVNTLITEGAVTNIYFTTMTIQ